MSHVSIVQSGAQSEPFPASATAPDGPYARIAILRPHDGDTVDFEAGYIVTWSSTGRPRTRGCGMAGRLGRGTTAVVRLRNFGHWAGSLDSPVTPAEDERDNIANVTPHAQFAGNAVYEY